MDLVLRIVTFVVVVSGSLALVGCDDHSPRMVHETDEYSFDDMAAQAAAETALSEVEE